MVHENDRSKRLSHMQDEMGRLMHHDEQELLSVWEFWHWDNNKAGGLIQSCAKARREEVEYIRRHRMYTSVPREVCLRETEKGPIKTGWAETDKGQPGKPNVRGGGSRRSTGHTRDQSCSRRSPRANVETRSWPWWTCEGRISTLQHDERCLSNCHPRTPSQVTHTCAGYCGTVCTAHATRHRIGKSSSHLRAAA